MDDRAAADEDVIYLDGPEYGILFADSEAAAGRDRSAGTLYSTVFGAETPDETYARGGTAEKNWLGEEGEIAGEYGDGAAGRIATSGVEAPFPQTDGRTWSRKTKRRYMKTFFVLEGEYHPELQPARAISKFTQRPAVSNRTERNTFARPCAETLSSSNSDKSNSFPLEGDSTVFGRDAYSMINSATTFSSFPSARTSRSRARPGNPSTAGRTG